MRTLSFLPLLLLAVACSGKVSIGQNETTQSNLKKNPDGSATGDGQTCSYGGHAAKVGDKFPAPDGCNTCTCAVEGAYCTELGCISDGGTVPPGTCNYNGHTYQDGESFPSSDGCNTCSCTVNTTGGAPSGVICTERACAVRDCSAKGACTGPAPGMPNWQCADGSTGGPMCSPTANDTCGWVINECSCQGAPTHKAGDSWQEACSSCACDQSGMVACTASACTCPPNGTVNCMPPVQPSQQDLCSGSYHTWVTQNCPNVKFVY